MTAPEPSPDSRFAIDLAWHNTDQLARPANQFLVSVGLPDTSGQPDSVYLTIGQVEPPVLNGTPAQMEQRLREMGSLRVETLGRYVLSRARLQELIDVLQGAAEIFDKTGGSDLGDTADDDAK
ncbi:hypothetical protein ACFY2K_00785 [Kitasatospora sp. NPDC001309]|uniref:hypothetical protein n=1 Tax=Kitasatospora sp. NPDC001309 TaxID=3364013 RepID=UPI00369CFE9C